MTITFSATNPCHMYEWARALHQRGVLQAYHSGYPAWKLQPPAGFPLRQHIGRTLATYALHRLPAACRPRMPRVFRWQDEGFDRAVARSLDRCDFVHAIPGQALQTFRRAKALGSLTVLNHATGPVKEQLRLTLPEYERVGLKQSQFHAYDQHYFAREAQEFALADFHCAASTVVKEQLLDYGLPADRIWVVPYGADPSRFFSASQPARSATEEDTFQILFAGQLVLRKGLTTLLAALELLSYSEVKRGRRPVRLDCYGSVSHETAADFRNYHGQIPITIHGPVSQAALAAVFRNASILVLPSLEEGFGLVIPQALACGLPCIVSDRVGAKDLIRHRRNGSVYPVQNAGALAEELRWWSRHNPVFQEHPPSWTTAAEILIAVSSHALETKSSHPS